MNRKIEIELEIEFSGDHDMEIEELLNHVTYELFAKSQYN